MSKEKVSIQDLVDAISQQVGSSKKKAEDFLRVFQSTIEEGLVNDGIVKIKGFGTFKLVWNAPRKSVNVQTKEEYVIPGHYKVSFIPEASVKDTINEPMTGRISEKKKDEESLPLKKLNEQAEEIKVLISELNEVNKTEEKEEKVEMVSEDVKTEEVKSEPIAPVVVSEKSEDHHAPEDYQIHERDIPVVQKKKKRTWLIIPFVVLLLAGAGYALYELDLLPKAPSPRLEDLVAAEDSTSVNSEKITEKEPVVNVADSAAVVDTPKVEESKVVEEAPKPVEVEKVPVKEEPKVSIFDKKRVYKEFIGSVTIEKGSRLTLIAEEKYGHKNFWVYIYEANKARIQNPGNLQIGFVVKLPKLPAELIDVNNSECVEYAAELERKYASK